MTTDSSESKRKLSVSEDSEPSDAKCVSVKIGEYYGQHPDRNKLEKLGKICSECWVAFESSKLHKHNDAEWLCSRHKKMYSNLGIQ